MSHRRNTLEDSETSSKLLEDADASMEKLTIKGRIKPAKPMIKEPVIPVRKTAGLFPKYFSRIKKVVDYTYNADEEWKPFRTVPCKKSKKKRGYLDGKTKMNNRLYVETPQHRILTVLEHDKGYNKIVEGRPIRGEFSIRDYIQNIRDSLTTKILIDYRRNDVDALRKKLNEESKIIQKVSEDLKVYSKVFDRILSEDHSSSSSLINESNEKQRNYDKLREECANWKKKFNSMKAALYHSEVKWDRTNACRRFLSYISPLHWKKTHDDRMSVLDSMEEEILLYTEEQNDYKSERVLDESIEHMQKVCLDLEPPRLYFNEPEELINLFKYMEYQNMNYLLHVEEVGAPLEKIHINMENAALSFDQKIFSIKHSINELTEIIEWEENSAQNFRKMINSVIHNEFKKLIKSKEVLDLYVFVEDVYESIGSSEVIDRNILTMMESIERQYRKEKLSLDKVPCEMAKLLESKYNIESKKLIESASLAQKQHLEFEMALKSLRKAYQAPFKKRQTRELKGRSKVAVCRKLKLMPARHLTAQESDYLEYFTDFCEYTDDPFEYVENSMVEINDITNETI
ncbi:unnamed protein product [Phyllotreta striolata]|uniref:Uncharacterized protein n=1 Tax=Phyllotreta striolata TaxID=444603 RepID=A0A9N9XLW5_PHYSR|nr:unnamed protein product [Phyllotreta striolata]